MDFSLTHKSLFRAYFPPVTLFLGHALFYIFSMASFPPQFLFLFFKGTDTLSHYYNAPWSPHLLGPFKNDIFLKQDKLQCRDGEVSSGTWQLQLWPRENPHEKALFHPNTHKSTFAWNIRENVLSFGTCRLQGKCPKGSNTPLCQLPKRSASVWWPLQWWYIQLHMETAPYQITPWDMCRMQFLAPSSLSPTSELAERVKILHTKGWWAEWSCSCSETF